MSSFILIAAAFLLSWALTGLLVRGLTAPAHLAMPNARSMHTVPTPVGGGMAIIVTLLILLPSWQGGLPPDVRIMLGAMALLAVVSALDQYTTVWPLTRILAQILAVALVLGTLPETPRLFAGLPIMAERMALGLAWIWLINVNNFMDGIDGMAGAEAVAVALGVLAVLTLRLGRGQSIEAAVALVLVGACLGYLVWNWAPARIFMGDVGAVPLGFVMGWLLLDLVRSGAWAAALLLPLLFIADATVTLLRRLLRGERPWGPHRNHFFQRAVRGTWSVPGVVALLSVCNASLILLAAHPLDRPLARVTAGLGIAAFFLAMLAKSAAPFEQPPQT